MLSFLPSALVLGLAALASLVLARRWRSPVQAARERHAASRALAVATVVQGVHFGEEAATGLPERLGTLFSLPPMSYSFFVLFNLTWLGIWLASIRGLRSRHAGAFFAAWFLAIAGVLNGIVHPVMAVRVNGYFPGLLSSPFVGLASAWLAVRLTRAARGTAPGEMRGG